MYIHYKLYISTKLLTNKPNNQYIYILFAIHDILLILHNLAHTYCTIYTTRYTYCNMHIYQQLVSQSNIYTYAFDNILLTNTYTTIHIYQQLLHKSHTIYTHCDANTNAIQYTKYTCQTYSHI